VSEPIEVLAARPPTRTFMVIRYVSWVGIIAHAGFIGLFALLGVPVMALFNIYSVAAWVGAREANRRGRQQLAVALLVSEVWCHALLAVWYVGWASGFHYYLIPLVPFLMFNDQLRARTAVLGSVAITMSYVALRIATFDATPSAIPPMALHWIYCANMVIPMTALAGSSFYFRSASIDLERAMEALAMTDALTSLPNRHRMRELLEYERARSQRGGASFGVILGDVDGFKQINDRHGHEAGDLVLRELAAVLRAALRGQDVAARWGGEEFLFLLPGTDLSGAAVAAEKLRAAVETAEICFASERLQVAMTFGVAAGTGTISTDDCVRRADRALYVGKDRGKNRVILDSEVVAS
jgi:diguanylate cyclase (GGDEF)-like protein